MTSRKKKRGRKGRRNVVKYEDHLVLSSIDERQVNESEPSFRVSSSSSLCLFVRVKLVDGKMYIVAERRRKVKEPTIVELDIQMQIDT
jgi:hypothetical protein